MGRPESERRFLRTAVKEGFISVGQAGNVVGELERRNERGLHAIRDLVIRTGHLAEKVAYRVFQQVSREMREVPEDLEKVGGFEILEPLAKGSMSAVVKARQVSLDRVVALKILPPGLAEDPVYYERFLREARAVARLNHPNIVAALDAGDADGYPFFAMEFVDGSTVREIVAAKGPIDEREALKIAYFVGRALKHAHAAGIVHRDIKPANVMLTRDGRVKLTDLGLARVDEAGDPSLTQDGKSVGTPYYMSPEQAVRGQVADARSDIYALGATLFYMLTGRPPYEADTPSAILAKHVRDPIPDPRAFNADVSERTVVILRRMLAKRPEERFATPGECASALKSVLQGRSPHSPDPDAPSVRGIPALPQLPALPRVAPVPWPQGAQPVYVAEAPPGTRGGGTRSAASSMQLTPVWLDPVPRPPPTRRIRRASARAPAAGAGAPAGVALVLALVAVGAGLVVFISGRDEVPARRGESVSARGGYDGGREPSRGAASGGAPGAAVAHADGRAGPTPAPKQGALSLDEEQLRRAEALDRIEAERRAEDPGSRLEEEARRNALEAEKLAEGAKAERVARERAAAQKLEDDTASEERAHLRLLDDVARRLKAEDTSGALELVARAAEGYRTPRTRALAERDQAFLKAMDDLVLEAAKGLEKKKGQKERLEQRKLPPTEGEVVEVKGLEVTIAPPLGGRIAVQVRELTLYEQRRLARVALGERSPVVYAAEGFFYLYSAEMAKARRRFEAAAREGWDAEAALARTAEIEAARGGEKAPPAELAGDPAKPAEKPQAPGEGGGEEPGAGTGAEAGAGGKPAEAIQLSEAMLTRIFQYPPVAFAPDGSVRFRYDLVEQKRLPDDFALEGGDLRLDGETKTLKIEGPPRRITHRAVFTGPLKLEVQLAFPTALGRSSAVVLFAEETAQRGTAVESVFGLDLTDRRKGRAFARAGPVDPVEQAGKELKTGLGYKLHLDLAALTTAGIDAGNRAVLEGVDAGGQRARRVGIATAGVNAQLRGFEVEGRLDLRWVAKELSRRPLLPR